MHVRSIKRFACVNGHQHSIKKQSRYSLSSNDSLLLELPSTKTRPTHMNFKEHIDEVTKKASKQVGVLLRLRNIIPQSAKLKIYKTAILPLLTYCHFVWHFCAASDARKLERVQEKALRAV